MDPVSGRERVPLLDVLRGVAIFGMFTVNMTADLLWGDTFGDMDLGPLDFGALVFVDLFTNGKFITIFSFLFGVGFFVQIERARARGDRHTTFYLRRSIGLLLIGIGAMSLNLLSWILIDYAIFGLVLLPFFRRSPRTILVAAIACFVVSKVFASILPDYFASLELEAMAIEQGVSVADVVQPEDVADVAREDAFRNGSFFAVSAALLGAAWEGFSDWFYYVDNLDLLGLLLLGLYVGRRGAVWDADVRRAIARRVCPWLIGIGFTGCLGWVVMTDFGVGDASTLGHRIVSGALQWPIGMPLLGLGYAAAIALLIERPTLERLLAPFAAVGRMALTNYLFTNLVIAVVSFPWGFALYGEMMPATGLSIVLVVYPLQVLASRWWMARFQFGPFEWLWRWFTYGHKPAMRVHASGR